MNTIRNFGTVLDSNTEDDHVILYKPGNYPLPVSSDRVAAELSYYHLVVNLPLPAVVGDWSGKSIVLTLKPFATSPVLDVKRIDLRPGVVPYTIDLITILFGEASPLLSPDSELGVKVIDAGYSFLVPTETLTVYGAAIEEMEVNSQTVLQRLA